MSFNCKYTYKLTSICRVWQVNGWLQSLAKDLRLFIHLKACLSVSANLSHYQPSLPSVRVTR